MSFKIVFQQHKKTFFRYFIVAVIFVLGLLIGWEINNLSSKHRLVSGQVVIREHQSDFKLISPLLVLGDSASLKGFKSLDNQLSSIINDAKNGQKIADASVYFRDFNSGQWMGVNERANYAPASIYKIAIMFAILKAAESDASLFSKELILDAKLQDRSASAELDTPRIETGKPYTVSELISRMIIYSDNDALNMLESIINPNDQKKIFDDLQMPMPLANDNRDSMSPELVSRFFRVLYNAAYMPRSISEFALELLSATAFKDGLVAGVSSGVTVAHKYGYRASSEQIPDNELHDCGIIYHPLHPYFLCVMTKGQDVQNLKDIIQQISRAVYLEADGAVNN